MYARVSACVLYIRPPKQVLSFECCDLFFSLFVLLSLFSRSRRGSRRKKEIETKHECFAVGGPILNIETHIHESVRERKREKERKE